MEQEALRPRPYFSVDLGASFVQGTTLKSSGAFIQSGKMKFDPGAQFDVAFGSQFGSLAVEFETGIIANSTSSIQDEFGGGGDFAFYQVPFLVNFYYHIPTRSRFHPFVGVGVGGVASILENYDLFYGSSDDTFGFGCQGLAGCTYQITRTMDLGLRYKYLGVADRTFDSLDLKMGWTHTHSVTAYFSLKF